MLAVSLFVYLCGSLRDKYPFADSNDMSLHSHWFTRSHTPQLPGRLCNPVRWLRIILRHSYLFNSVQGHIDYQAAQAG